MTDPSDPLPELQAAAAAAAERGEVALSEELAVELLRHDPDNRVAHRILVRGTGEAPAEMRRLTILFCDLVGSTRMSVHHDPDAYGRLLQRYHRLCDEVIAEHGGVVNKRSGDGVLALFGHPHSHEDDTRRAVRAGLALTRRVAASQAEMTRDFGECLEVRVAIHVGLVHLSLLDSEVYGLAPNLAARLQDLAVSGTVVVSDDVIEIVGGSFETRSHEPAVVKGVDEPVGYHTVERELPHTPGRGRTWRTPFIGRDRDRDRLRAAISDGSPVVVRGEPGIGKSRLVTEVLDEHAEPGARVHLILCTEYEQRTDLGAASSLLRLDPSVPDVGPERRLQQLHDDLAALDLPADTHIGLLAPLLGLDPSLGYTLPETDLARMHDRVLSSLRAWLTALGSRRPFVLRVEDVHWVDPSTCELLVGLVASPIDGVQLVATERTGTALLHGPGLVEIGLAPLCDDDAAVLARSVDDAIDGDRLDAALRRGQGNPLFIEELARAPVAPAPVDPELLTRLMDESMVPGALYEPLVARLYGSGVDVGVAQAAATIGRSFTRDVLAAVLPRPPEVLDRGIRSLLDAGLLDEETDGPYWFRHALIRDVAYDLQPREQRSGMHRRVGDTLRARREDGADVSWSVIATHYHAAGRFDEAIDGYVAAAEDSRERGSMALGVEHLSTAIDLIASHAAHDDASVRREIDLRLKRGFLCVSTGGNADPRAVADYQRCLDLIRLEEHGAEFVATLVALWGYHTARGDLDRADGLLDEILATGITEDEVMLAENRTARGMVRFFQGDFAAAEEHLRWAVDGVPDEVQHTRPPSPWQFPNDPVASMHVQYGLARWQRGDLAGWHDQVRRARRRVEQLPRPYGPFNLAYALTYQAWVSTEVGDYDDASVATEELLEISDRYGFDFWTLAGTTADAITVGRRVLASGGSGPEVLLEQVERLAGTSLVTRMIDSKLLLPYGLTAQAQFLSAAGEPRRALALLDDALEVATSTTSRFYLAETQRSRAVTRAALGDPQAEEDLHLAVSTASRQGSIPFELRARLALSELGQRTDRLDELWSDPAFVAASGVAPRAGAPPT